MFVFFVQATFADPKCSNPLRKEDFVQYLDSIELDFVKADLPSIEKKLTVLEESIPCLSQRLLPEQAARYHILSGLRYWIADDESQAKRSFAVAKRTDPNASISTHAFPQEHFIHELYAQVPPVEYDSITTKPEVGSYSFDGYLIPRRPQQAPTIMQIVDTDVVYTSAYLQPDAPLLNFQKKRKHHKTIALGASAIAMAIGVGFQASAQLYRKDYLETVQEFDAMASVGPSERIIIANSLKNDYENHIKQYQVSFTALGIGSAILGFSYFLEW